MIGIRHVVTSFHIVSTCVFLKWRSPAMASIVWKAVSSFLSSCFIWSLRFVLSFIISPRYLYVVVRSSVICSYVNCGLSLVFPIMFVWHFPLLNLMWYFSATLLMLSSSCFSSGLVSRSTTSSIHSRHTILVSVLCILIPRSVPWISLFISSISSAYRSTERTPPCPPCQY